MFDVVFFPHGVRLNLQTKKILSLKSHILPFPEIPKKKKKKKIPERDLGLAQPG